MDRIELISKLMSIPTILIAITFHEYAHGRVANKLGDPTAKALGRLSLNPIKHLDPLGALCMLMFGYGWAKPVPINTRYFKKPKRDMALTALAGPLTNIALGFVGMLLFAIVAKLFSFAPTEGAWADFQFMTLLFLQYFYTLNIAFAVFNMLPIPPFDGSRVLFSFLPPKYYFGIMRYERQIMLGFFILLIAGSWVPQLNIISTVLGFFTNIITKGMAFVIGLIPFI